MFKLILFGAILFLGIKYGGKFNLNREKILPKKRIRRRERLLNHHEQHAFLMLQVALEGESITIYPKVGISALMPEEKSGALIPFLLVAEATQDPLLAIFLSENDGPLEEMAKKRLTDGEEKHLPILSLSAAQYNHAPQLNQTIMRAIRSD